MNCVGFSYNTFFQIKSVANKANVINFIVKRCRIKFGMTGARKVLHDRCTDKFGMTVYYENQFFLGVEPKIDFRNGLFSSIELFQAIVYTCTYETRAKLYSYLLRQRHCGP